MQRFMGILLFTVIVTTIATGNHVLGAVATAALMAAYDLANLAGALYQPPD